MKSGPGTRASTAALHRAPRRGLKGVQVFAALPVQRDFDQGAQAVAQAGGQFVGAQHRHLPLNPAALGQPFDAAKASGGRHVHPLGQCHIADAGIVLQGVEQLQVDGVEFILFHIIYFIEILIQL
jgi:hypothetical protein